MAIEVVLTGILTGQERNREIRVDAPVRNLDELLKELIRLVPDMEERIAEPDGSISLSVRAFVNEKDTGNLEGMATPIRDGDRVVFVVAAGGG